MDREAAATKLEAVARGRSTRRGLTKQQEPQKQLEAAASKKPKSSVSGRPVTSDSENGWCLLRLPTTPFSCDALVSFANIAAKDVPDADNNSGGEHTRCVVQTGRLLDGSFALTRAVHSNSRVAQPTNRIRT